MDLFPDDAKVSSSGMPNQENARPHSRVPPWAAATTGTGGWGRAGPLEGSGDDRDRALALQAEVVQAERVGDHTRAVVLLAGQRLAVPRLRPVECVLPGRDG